MHIKVFAFDDDFMLFDGTEEGIPEDMDTEEGPRRKWSVRKMVKKVSKTRYALFSLRALSVHAHA